jgi:hypothetical protein
MTEHADHDTGGHQEVMPLLVKRARNRAAECARDAAECIDLGRIDDARSLLAEAQHELDTAERRTEAAR